MYFMGIRSGTRANVAWVTVSVATMVAAVSVAHAASVKEVFEKNNLIGTFAWDCSKPPGKNNWYYVNRVIDDDHVQRDLMHSEGERFYYTTLDRAREQNGNEIVVSGMRNGQDPVTSVWRLEGTSMLQWESTRNGKPEIKENKLLSSGRPMPRVNKCGS